MATQKIVFKDGDMAFELRHVKRVLGFGTPPVNLTMKPKGWRRDGVNIQWAGYEPRPFTIDFNIDGENYAAAAAERRSLMRFFADKKARILEYTRFDGVVLTLFPVYLAAPSEPDMRETLHLSEVMQFVAGNPYFQTYMPESSMLFEVAVHEWPEMGLEWPEGGIEYSWAQNKMQIVNEGDIHADSIIRFIGEAVNPFIENLTTGQKIEVGRALHDGDVLEINSATGRVDIIDSEGVRHNAFNYIGDSEFITLAPGTNIIEFGSAGGSGYIEVGGTKYYATGI